MARKNKKIKSPGFSRQKNKNGVSVFDNSEDLFSLFMEKKEYNEKRKEFSNKKHFPENTSQYSSEIVEQGKKHGQNYCCKKNKHGIKILDHSGNITDILLKNNECNNGQNNYYDNNGSTDNGSYDSDDNFAEMLDSSLKGKNMQALMREKKDAPKPAIVPLKKRLKRYPPPQKLLDLHGNTASMAEIKAEAYIRTCQRDGIFTIRIVVGKGLHSKYGAVLPDVIEDLLIKLKKEKIVLWFTWDKKKKSNSGALIVYLKQF